jgi:drug/metabolite transporter (DMT)-like permease
MIPATFVAAYPYLIMPNLYQFLIILFIAITGTIAQTLLNSAFKRGQLAILLPFDYLKLIWSVLIGYTIFVESTPISLWIGGTLIVGASSYIAWRERN